jgi:DNA-directed RNA polymerase subunit RPC12/RpoP
MAVRKKCTICGTKTEDWEIVNGGPVRCWECGKEIRESEDRRPANAEKSQVKRHDR